MRNKSESCSAESKLVVAGLKDTFLPDLNRVFNHLFVYDLFDYYDDRKIFFFFGVESKCSCVFFSVSECMNCSASLSVRQMQEE